MRLFLREDLVKAVGGPGTPAPPAPAGGTPSDLGSPSQNMQPCSVGGGEACLRAGGNGAETHKVGGAIERRHAEWRASQGAGAAQTETAAPESKMTPEEAQETVQDAVASSRELDPKYTKGTTSTDPDFYPPDSKPFDHYKVAAAHEAMGGGNDSAKEIAEGHRAIARQRAEKLSADEHAELANQLREAGLNDEADHHDKQAGEARAREKESVDTEFDTMMEDTEGVEQDVQATEAARKEAAELGPRMEKQKEEAAAAEKTKKDEEARLKDEDPHAHAMKEWEQKKSEIDEKHQQQLEEHKSKIDKEHEKAVKEWEGKKKERDAWEKLKKEHAEKKPVPPEPVTSERPQAKDYALDTPEGKKKFEADVKAHEKAQDQYKKDKAKHKSKTHAHKAEGIALNKQRPPMPGKKPKKPSYTKGAPKKPEYPEQPKAEDYEMKKPQSAAEKASHAEYTQSAKTARENIQSHLENNPDLSDEEKQKLQAAHEALGAHAEAERMPTKEQSSEAKKMSQVAGKYGKEAYQSPEDKAAEKEAEKKATEEAPRPPASDLEKIQLTDHKSKAQQMRDNIQSHIDAIQKDPSLSPEQQSAQVEKLQQIHDTLESHTQLENMPSSEQQAELKELTKLAGEHGKKPAEAPEGEEAQQQKPAREAKGRPKDWAAAFGRGAHLGSNIAESMRTGTGAAQGTMAGVSAAAGGVVSAGDSLLATPSRNAVEARKKAADQEAEAAQKKNKQVSKEEETVKGLYLNLDADLDLLKAVTPPNVGSSTLSDKRAQRKTKESYAKNPVGVMGGSGIAMYDDPDVGKQWKHDEEDSVDAELEEEVRNQEEDEDAEKSVAVVLLKSIRGVAEQDAKRYRPNESEVVFMRDVLGYNESDIMKGLVGIRGRDRHRFHEWMLDRMYKSLGSMMECVNG